MYKYVSVKASDNETTRSELDARFFEHRRVSNWEGNDCYIIEKDGIAFMMQVADNSLFPGNTVDEIATNHINQLIQEEISIQTEQNFENSIKAADALLKWKQLFDQGLIDETTYEAQKTIAFGMLNAIN